MIVLQERARERAEDVLRGSGKEGLDETSSGWVDQFYRGGDERGSATDARARAAEIVSGEAFEDGEPGWFEKWWDEVWGENEGEGEGESEASVRPPQSDSSGSGARMIGWVAIALLLGLIVVLLSGRIARRRRVEVQGGDPAERVASRVAELRERARQAELAGDWIEALRLDFFALVVGLGERGDLEYRDAWTNRELLERGHPHAQVQHDLQPVVERLNAHSFGHLPGGPDEVREFRSFCDKMLERRA